MYSNVVRVNIKRTNNSRVPKQIIVLTVPTELAGDGVSESVRKYTLRGKNEQTNKNKLQT